MPTPTNNDWSLKPDATPKHSDQQSNRPALLASIAIHTVLLALLVGVGFNVRSRAIHDLNLPGPQSPRDSAGFAGLQIGRGTWRGGCGWIGDSTSAELLRVARHRVSATEAPDSGSVLLPPMDPALVRAIDADSLCQLAGQAIDKLVSPLTGYRPRRLFLIRAGSVYLAVDTSLRGALPREAFLLDSSVSRVLSRGRP